MRSARGHASLLLYNAGNEIFPPNETWAPAPLSALADELDPRGTPFEWSSMGNISEWWLPDKVGGRRAQRCERGQHMHPPDLNLRSLRLKTVTMGLTTPVSTSVATPA